MSGGKTVLYDGEPVTTEGLGIRGCIVSALCSHSSFKGIAIRIEDDVLLTDAGNEVLSASCPKRVDEIEALVGTAPSS